MTDPAALLIALLGLALLIWAHRFTAFVMRGPAWQRRNVPDPTIGLQERIVAGRPFTWFLRAVGALILLGAALSALGLPQEAAR